MKLIITRHGETEENKAGILQGQLPWTLSETGILQARKVALRLKDEEIDYIYSSDLARSADTAKEIQKHHPKTHITFTAELRERSLWEFQWKSKSDRGGWDIDSRPNLELQGWETMRAVYERTKTFLNRIFDKHSKDIVLLVWHNGINKTLIAHILWKAYDELWTLEKQHNTSVNIFKIDKEKNFTILEYNSIDHLS